ncbi:MAG: hypothetical protein Q9220_004434 [cf. Caloplaca sp. 1 TL-2023]
MAATERDFHHPFHPYEIQVQLMNAVYDCIEEGKVGIFESPTGTGKSLSLICSTLLWLQDEQRRTLDAKIKVEEDPEEPAWVVDQARRQRTESLLQRRLELEYRLAKIREKEKRQKQRYERGQPLKKRAKLGHDTLSAESEDDSQFLLDDYESDDEHRRSNKMQNPGDVLSSASSHLMQELSGPSGSVQEEIEPELDDEPKIYFCSRTHSQLTQFVNELRRVRFGRDAWAEDENMPSSGYSQSQRVIKHLPLGSRKNLCINPKVAGCGSSMSINERCLELQQPSTPKEKKCPFLPNKENEVLVNEFRDHSLANIRDIEDLGALGNRIGICPYYAARASIKPSEVIITLPYQLLLQKSARDALGISLKGNIVVIDEAHNLMDTISNIHSISITQGQLHRCQSQLRNYLQRFRNMLKGKNRVYMTQAVRLVDSISGYLDRMASQYSGVEVLVNISDLMSGKGVDQINLHSLIQYLAESKIARKIQGYSDHHETIKSTTSKSNTDATPVLLHIHNFLQTLTNPAAEGRFFVEKNEIGSLILKYILLDPTFHFKDIVEESRAVVLAGGTMSPMTDYNRHLFAYMNQNRLRTWNCGHIIPKDNLFLRSIGIAEDGTELDFSFATRGSFPRIQALGVCLIRLAESIPDGLVVFFPSYIYLDQVSAQWQTVSPGVDNIWTGLEEHKVIFKESKGSAGIEDVLQQYSHTIDHGKGAILLSVVGGKMSEGINFSDKLGRGVAVVGLPFPNIHSAQWRAKLEYIEHSTVAGGGSSTEGKTIGRDFYENACMRAVNQSIGRAIRHRSDFASILLLDRRYSLPRIANKLPGWIKQSFSEDRASAPLADVTQDLRRFFKMKAVDM